MKILQQFILMSIGAVFGGGCLSMSLLAYFYGYDHGKGETAICTLSGSLLGAFAGLVLYQFSKDPSQPRPHSPVNAQIKKDQTDGDSST